MPLAQEFSAGRVVARIQQIEHRTHLGVCHQLLAMTNVAHEIAKVGSEVVLPIGHHHDEPALRTRHRHIEQLCIIYKLADLIVHRGHNDGLLLATLKTVNGVYFDTSPMASLNSSTWAR